MGKQSGIAWTHHTFNPWWGCTKVEGRPACQHCYAERQANRFGLWWGEGVERKTFGAKHWNEPYTWSRAAAKAGVRERVFCGSMCDLLDPEVPATWRDPLWLMVESTPSLDWLLLTKRLELAPDLFPARWVRDGLPTNVWLGTTVETQAVANVEVPRLLEWRDRASVLWVSMEPLLGPVDLTALPWGEVSQLDALLGESLSLESGCLVSQDAPALDWVIVGGESGPLARPSASEWYRDLRDQCQQAGVPFFFKQHGEWVDVSHPAFYSTRGNICYLDPVTGRRYAYDTPSEVTGANERVTMKRVGLEAAGHLFDGVERRDVPVSPFHSEGR